MKFIAQAIPFLHPTLALWALAAGLLPILIHLINRRRYRRVPWAAMSFLLSANQRSRRRLRMEQLLLLATRVAAVVLLGLAVARPYVSAAPLGGLGVTRVHRVLVLDNSLSLQSLVDARTTRYDRIQAAAGEWLAALPEGDPVSIVTTATPAEALIEQPVADRRVLREQLRSVPVHPKPADWDQALDLVRGILKQSSSPQGNRAVTVLSDFRQADWIEDQATSAVSALRQLAEENAAPDIQVLRVDGGLEGNTGIADLYMESALATVRLPARVITRVVNHSPVVQRGLSLQFRRGGQVLRRETIAEIEPGGAATVDTPLEFSQSGTHMVEVYLEGAVADALAVDDARYLSVEVRDQVSVLLVDGQPGPTPLSGQAGYLATALQPVADVASSWEGGAGARVSESSLIDAKVVGAAELGNEVLGEYDVIALCNVARLSPRQWEQLRDVVSRGTGLAVFAGDLVAVEHYNEFAHQEDARLIPGLLAHVAALGVRADAPGGFQLTDPPHAMVAEFARFADSGLFTARVDRYLPITPDEQDAEVALRFTNGEPALVVGAHGVGRVAYLATTANMAWNNLAARGDYVSLSLNLIAYLAPRRGGQRNLLAGETLREPLRAAESGLPLRVTTSDGAAHEPRLVVEGEHMYLTLGPLNRIGPFTLSVGGEQRGGCVNVDGTALDVTTAAPDALEAALGGNVSVTRAAAASGQASRRGRAAELVKTILMVAGALLIAEMWMAGRFGVRHAPE